MGQGTALGFSVLARTSRCSAVALVLAGRKHLVVVVVAVVPDQRRDPLCVAVTDLDSLPSWQMGSNGLASEIGLAGALGLPQ